MTKNEPPIFGENGAILNADDMQQQSEWPKPQPQGLTRKQWISIIVVALISMIATTASMVWKLF